MTIAIVVSKSKIATIQGHHRFNKRQLFMHVYVSKCVCVCVCVRERERETSIYIRLLFKFSDIHMSIAQKNFFVSPWFLRMICGT